LCPARLVDNSAEEMKIHSFENELEVVRLNQKTKAKKIKRLQELIRYEGNKPQVIIVGYETASKLQERADTQYWELISKFGYEVAILDESHKLRSIKSNVSNIIAKLVSKAYRRILMTGTPSLGDPLHLYVQMRVLLPWLYPNYFSFKFKYCEISSHNKNIITGYKNLHLIRRQVDTFSIQKTKEECLDLPARSTHVIRIDMSHEQANLYEEVRAGTHTSVEYNPLAVLMQTKMHQICGGTLVDSPIDYTVCENCPSMPRCVEYQYTPFSKNCERKDLERPITNIFIKNNPKLDRLKELLTTICKGEGKKVILWYKYLNEYKLLTEMLKKEKLNFLDYGKLKHSAVTKFQNDAGSGIFLAQIQSSSGITLTAAEYTIYYSLTFDLEHYLQSRDRMYRKGQTKKTIEYHLVMRYSIDEAISSALQRKELINEAMLRQDLHKQIISDVKKK
jgi:SNF2 family DNA or RNA helicase